APNECHPDHLNVGRQAKVVAQFAPNRWIMERYGAEAADVGLAMLLLKDLSLGRVPLGGEKSIGRGVLEGIHAEIWYKPKREEDHNNEIKVVVENGKPVEGDAKALESCVNALAKKAKGTEATA
ncbi:MAG: hypothetical protein IKW79_06520, partial [Schwartzia sp.]|nr:hypothetical protein [Schwartzia sp. (in: firmicutes)]